MRMGMGMVMVLMLMCRRGYCQRDGAVFKVKLEPFSAANANDGMVIER